MLIFYWKVGETENLSVILQKKKCTKYFEHKILDEPDKQNTWWRKPWILWNLFVEE